MFDDKKITKEKINTILYAVYNEYENEIDTIEDVFGKEITNEQLDFAFEFLRKYIDKVELVINDELKNEGE